MSEERTITVNGYFGEQQMNKADFTKNWTDHVGELLKIDYSDKWTREVTKIGKTVNAKCHEEFDRLYEAQNKDEIA